MNENEETTRRLQLLRCIPEILNSKGKQMLYVGGHLRYGRDLQMCGLFRDAGFSIDIIEIFPENVDQLRTVKWINRVIEGDIRDFDTERKYDVVMFWHGPEHLKSSEVGPLLETMKGYAKFIVFATPNGKYEQGDEYGNKHERHVTHWYKDDFIKLGMKADAIGQPDARQGNIIAWLKVE